MTSMNASTVFKAVALSTPVVFEISLIISALVILLNNIIIDLIMCF